jgi:hypothetical protein
MQLPSLGRSPVLVLLAGKVYADALRHGAHWHNLPRPEEPLACISGCGARVKWLRVERVRTKIARLAPAQKCRADCPTWGVTDTPRGKKIEPCAACWRGAPDPLTDDEAALLPEAQEQLAAIEGEALDTSCCQRREEAPCAG